MATTEKNNYFEKRKINCIKRMEAVIEELPYFCREFFIGIENNTSPLTRLNYAMDLRIFFDFLVKKVFINMTIEKFDLTDLEKVKSSDIEHYLSYLNSYTHDGKALSCNEKAKQRKLASIRALYKYFFNKEKIISNTAAKVRSPKIHDKEIIRLEIDEVVSMINTVESGNGLSGRQKA